jgi:hypothetical protein
MLPVNPRVAAAVLQEAAQLYTFKQLLRKQHTPDAVLPNPYPPSSTSEYTSMDEEDSNSLFSTGNPSEQGKPSSSPPM